MSSALRPASVAVRLVLAALMLSVRAAASEVSCVGHHTALSAVSANCTHIIGSLTIVGSTVTSLQSLAGLESVGGDLTIASTAIHTMQGLNDLTTVGGSLRILLNPRVSNLTGLASLTSIGAQLQVSQNAELTALDGIVNASAASFDISGSSNSQLTDPYGLCGHLTISDATSPSMPCLQVASNPRGGPVSSRVTVTATRTLLAANYGWQLTCDDGTDITAAAPYDSTISIRAGSICSLFMFGSSCAPPYQISSDLLRSPQISSDLLRSPHISSYLLISPHISLHLPCSDPPVRHLTRSPHISSYLLISPHISSHLPASPMFGSSCAPPHQISSDLLISPHISLHLPCSDPSVRHQLELPSKSSPLPQAASSLISIARPHSLRRMSSARRLDGAG